MNIDQVLSEYDAIESTHDFNKIESFILGKMEEAKEERDGKSLITLYNEILGLYREFSHYDRLIECCRDLLILMEEEGIVGTLPYATSLLNIANAVRSAGLHKESMVYYNEVLRIYDSNLSSDDPMYAPVYNNMALLFEEIEDYMSAIGCLNKVLLSD